MKHVFGLFDSNIAEGLDRSFSLEELEINEIEERASEPNFDKFNYLFVSQQLHSGKKHAETFARAEVKANTVQVSATMEIRYA